MGFKGAFDDECDDERGHGEHATDDDDHADDKEGFADEIHKKVLPGWGGKGCRTGVPG